jgi:hypothetical protein
LRPFRRAILDLVSALRQDLSRRAHSRRA